MLGAQGLGRAWRLSLGNAQAAQAAQGLSFLITLITMESDVYIRPVRSRLTLCFELNRYSYR